MAKSLVRNRHAVTKMYQLKSQLQAVSLRIAVRSWHSQFLSALVHCWRIPNPSITLTRLQPAYDVRACRRQSYCVCACHVRGSSLTPSICVPHLLLAPSTPMTTLVPVNQFNCAGCTSHRLCPGCSQTLKSTQAMSEAMKGATKAMGAMNRQMNLPALQKIMREFEVQNERMEMTSEVMGDAVDDVFEVRRSSPPIRWGPAPAPATSISA